MKVCDKCKKEISYYYGDDPVSCIYCHKDICNDCKSQVFRNHPCYRYHSFRCCEGCIWEFAQSLYYHLKFKRKGLTYKDPNSWGDDIDCHH